MNKLSPQRHGNTEKSRIDAISLIVLIHRKCFSIKSIRLLLWGSLCLGGSVVNGFRVEYK